MTTSDGVTPYPPEFAEPLLEKPLHLRANHFILRTHLLVRGWGHCS